MAPSRSPAQFDWDREAPGSHFAQGWEHAGKTRGFCKGAWPRSGSGRHGENVHLAVTSTTWLIKTMYDDLWKVALRALTDAQRTSSAAVEDSNWAQRAANILAGASSEALRAEYLKNAAEPSDSYIEAIGAEMERLSHSTTTCIDLPGDR
jgi:hypothetical protein